MDKAILQLVSALNVRYEATKARNDWDLWVFLTDCGYCKIDRVYLDIDDWLVTLLAPT